MRVEICVDSAEGAFAAERGGADRVELCDNLMEGGTTPSAGCIKVARRGLKIGLQVIIRPRGGDFLYTDSELEVMREDIRMAKDLGADGVVLGCLTAEGDIDCVRVEELIGLARPLNVTFHRAFDMCRNPQAALEELVKLGVERVLTSGQEASCLEGLDLIASLEKQAAGRIIVMPGGGITPRNVSRIIAGTGVKEVHLSARAAAESGMEYRNSRVFMGGTLRPAEFSWKATDEGIVRGVVNAVSGPRAF
ncbi:MAG TPA: copper homeostasis protein CutC [Verrucomicrobiae bacterium]|nr:copper homeostasis protein CutC [Verrucomicrobiae bacterium]